MIQHRDTTIGVEKRRPGFDYLPQWASTFVEIPLRWSFSNGVSNVNSDLHCVALRTNALSHICQGYVAPCYAAVSSTYGTNAAPSCHYVALRTDGVWSLERLYTLFADERTAPPYIHCASSLVHRLCGCCSCRTGELWHRLDAGESHASGLDSDGDHLPGTAGAHGGR